MARLGRALLLTRADPTVGTDGGWGRGMYGGWGRGMYGGWGRGYGGYGRGWGMGRGMYGGCTPQEKPHTLPSPRIQRKSA